MASLIKSFAKLNIASKTRVFVNFRPFSTEESITNLPRRLDFDISVSPEILPTISLANASSSQILKYKKQISVKKYQIHATDTGSTPVQISCITDKIRNMARHTAESTKDRSGVRRFQMLVHKRKKMMKYLMRTDYAKFVEVCNDLGLQREAKTMIRHVKARNTDGM